MTKKLMALLLILILVTVVACVTPAELVEKSKAKDTAEPTEEIPDLDDVTSIENELDLSSMDDLNQDLDDISW